MALLSEILVAKLEPVIITYGTVNSACEKSRRRQWQRAVALLCCIPNSACEARRLRQWLPAMALLIKMTVAKLEPNIITYGSLNRACEKSRR